MSTHTICLDVERDDADGSWSIGAPTSETLPLTLRSRNAIARAVESVTDEFEEAIAANEAGEHAEAQYDAARDRGEA
jgi:hypothetical protein